MKHLAAALMAGLMMATAANAATLVHYGFDATTDPEKYEPDTPPANVNASDVSPIGEISIALGTGIHKAGGSSLKIRADSVDNDSSSTGDRVEFTLTPTGGKGLDLESFSYWVKADAAAATSGINCHSLVYWSVDGYTTAISTDPSVRADAGTRSDWVNVTVDLTSAPVQFSSVTLRTVIWDGSGSSQKYHLLDEFTVEGDVIPAPAALPAGLMLLGLVVLRRRSA